MKMNYFLINLNYSPWPFMLSMNLMFLIMKLLNAFLFNLTMKIWFNIIILIMIIFMWMNNMFKEKYILGMKILLLNSSIKFMILLIISSEMMFFLTFFYIHYSMNYFSNLIMNSNLNNSIFKLNFLLALLNLLILLSSSISLTIFTYLNFINKINKIKFMNLTLLLTIYFLFIQIFEYKMMNFNLTNSIYYSNFFMLTMFHMNHVIMGLMLMIFYLMNMFKLINNFQNKIKLLCWYWHFVDMIWIMIFFFIY